MTAVAVAARLYYRAKCDSCGFDYEDPTGWGIVAFEFPSDAIVAATDTGWRYDIEAAKPLTCPSCLRCEECGDHPAWVGGPELDAHTRVLCAECDPSTPSTPAPPPGRKRGVALVLINGER